MVNSEHTWKSYLEMHTVLETPPPSLDYAYRTCGPVANTRNLTVNQLAS